MTAAKNKTLRKQVANTERLLNGAAPVSEERAPGRPAKYSQTKKVRSIRLTDHQVGVLIRATGTSTLQEAIEHIANQE